MEARHDEEMAARQDVEKLEADNAALREALRWTHEELRAREVFVKSEPAEYEMRMKQVERALLGEKP